MDDEELTAVRAARLDELRAEMIPRMRPICGAASESLLAEAVERMALIRLQFEERARRSSRKRGRTG